MMATPMRSAAKRSARTGSVHHGESHNSGDNVRTIELFYLMLCACAAVWSLPACISRSLNVRDRETPADVYVHAWPLRLLFVQLVILYFFNGVYKALGSHWREGDVLHYVLGNLAWTRISYAQL